ncbi:MAG: radical SAM family heme chaperone HemW, partial [Sedimentisphaerales bacterium]|nr:radical SAM family heme chaperone HemW [Sedimentisphaerales bacterium]
MTPPAAPSFPQSTPADCSVYIHIPFCTRKCRYCAFYSITADRQQQQDYLNAVRRELEMYRSCPPFSTIFLGGGSPSAIQRDLLYSLLDWIAPHAQPGAEMTVEVNPRQTDAEFFDQIRRRGINRISIGAQSFNPEELTFLGRIHDVQDIIQCVHDARTAGFDNIGLDLIFAIPGSTLSDWKDSLEEAIALRPRHISAYSLTYEGDTPLVRETAAGRIKPVSDELDRRMYDLTIDTLAAAGFEQYEISNFARPSFECRHNLRYWKNRPYIGLGPAAAGWFRGKRTENVPDLQQYIAAIERRQFAYESEHAPTPEEFACETAVLNLRTRTGIEPVEFQ